MKALIVTASIVLSALLLCVAWLAFFPGDAGGPVISVAVTPPPPKPSAPPPPKAAPAPSIDLPPGFGISPARPQSNPGGAAGSAAAGWDPGSTRRARSTPTGWRPDGCRAAAGRATARVAAAT